MAENQMERIMRILSCNEQEAKQIMADDKAIDRGERMPWDLTPEQEKAAKKYANATEHKKSENAAPRVRKENPTKAAAITAIAKCLEECGYETVTITNPERVISFAFGGDNYEVVLQQKRKPKT